MEKFCLCGLRIEKVFFIYSQKGYEKIARGRDKQDIFHRLVVLVEKLWVRERRKVNENLELNLENESFGEKFDEIPEKISIFKLFYGVCRL